MKFGAAVVALLLAAAVGAPFLAPYGPDGRGNASAAELLTTRRHLSPSREHPFGTDAQGRDVWSRALYGARVSLAIGILARGLAVAVGTFVGLLAGYLGGLWDRVLSRVIEVFLAFPGLLLAMAIGVALGASPVTVLVAIAAVSWTDAAVVIRAVSAELARRPFVQAARAQGASEVRIVLRHVLPHLAGPAAVLFTFGIAAAVMIESSLSFLGLAGAGGGATWFHAMLGLSGVEELPTWGAMIQAEEQYLARAPWGVFGPGVLLALAVLGWNVLGDALRDRLDVRSAEGPPA